MIISDLNHLEVVQETGVVGGYYKSFTAEVDIDLDFDANIDIDATKNVDVDINADVDITGNSAFLIGEVTSLGNNTTSEIDFAILTAGGVSEVSVTAYGATA